MNDNSSVSFYQKFAIILVILFMLCLGIIYGKEIILPILFSILLANILLPITNFLQQRRFNKPLSIMVPLIAAIVVGVGVLYFLSSQILNFIDDMPALKERIDQITHSLQLWLRENTHLTIRKQNQYIEETLEDLKDRMPQFVGFTFISVTSVLTYAVLLPIYTFLILYYRGMIKQFLIAVFKNGSEAKVSAVLMESTGIAQQYIIGLMIETTLVFALNTAGFLLLGIKYAVFLALLAALLNLIPYVGMLVANILCMLITLVSSEQYSMVLWVGVILALVQFLDNNFGMPLIVGNKVRINALVTIIGVLVGGALCGVPGMFLAIPGLAVLKVIFDKVDGMKPWGMLLSDTQVEFKNIISHSYGSGKKQN